MSKILQITENLRVRDSDSQQYVAERSIPPQEGKERNWTIIAYCGKPKTAQVAIQREYIMQATDAARAKALKELSTNEAFAEILDLPKKPSASVKGAGE